MRSTPWPAAWLVLALLLPGCGQEDADDDSAVGDDDDFVAADNEVTTTAAPPCAPLLSSFWKDMGVYEGYPLTLVASTEPGYCILTKAYETARIASSDAHFDDYMAALANEDGPGTCAALRAYYEGFLSDMAAVWPAGSCVVSVTLDEIEPAPYVIGAEEDGATVTVSYSEGVDVHGILEAFEGCETVDDWEDWLALNPVVSEALQFDGEIWSGQSGTVTLADTGDDSHAVQGASLTIVENYSGEPGTITFTLSGNPCDLPLPSGS